MIPLAWLRVELSFSRWTWTRGDGTASLEVEEQVDYQLFGVTLDFNQGNKNQHGPLEEVTELRSGEEQLEFPENILMSVGPFTLETIQGDMWAFKDGDW